jgi:hypothetical protein
MLRVALLAAHTQEAVLQSATGQVGVELLLDEIGQRNALLRKMRTKLGEILLDDLVEQRTFRAVAHIDRRRGHTPGIRAGWAGAALPPVSEAGSYINGESILADGGIFL